MATNPVIKCSVVDINPTTLALTGFNTILIRHFSTAKAAMQFEGGYNINLDTCIIRNGSQRVWGTEATFPNVETDLFEFAAEDSNGGYHEAEFVPVIVDYVKLTCNQVDGRPDGTGKMTARCSGEYFSGSFGVHSNTISVKCRYKTATGSWSNYINMSVSVVGNSYSASANLTGLNYEETYNFEYVATDALMSASSLAMNVTSLPVFHWGKDDVTFEGEANFNRRAQFNGGAGFNYIDQVIRLDSTARCYISEYPEGTMNIGGDVINLQANSLTHNGTPVAFAEYGRWTPGFYNCSGVYWDATGWYSKCGNVVTVGFRVNMTADAGYHNNDVTLVGLPYTPAAAASGGGMCSGARILTNKNFQCFVAETTGFITTRVQACDSTNGTNLETSASGCKYPNYGDITVSGTITYMTAI